MNEKRADLQAALSVIKASCPSRPSVNKSLIKPPAAAVASSSSRGTSHDSGNSDSSMTVYSCDSLLLKAARDFRLRVPLPSGCRRFGIRWELALVFPSASHARDQTLGFSIVRRQPDGLLPQLEPYKVYPASGGQGFVEVENDEENSNYTSDGPSATLVFLFDNTFSWYRQKRVRYRIEVFELVDESADDPVVDSTSLAAASQDSLIENALSQLDTVDSELADDCTSFSLPRLQSFTAFGETNDTEIASSSRELITWVRRALTFTVGTSIVYHTSIEKK